MFDEDSLSDLSYDDNLDCFGVRYMKSICSVVDYGSGAGCEFCREADWNTQTINCDYNSDGDDWRCDLGSSSWDCLVIFSNCTVDPRENPNTLYGAFDAGVPNAPKQDDIVCDNQIPPGSSVSTYTMDSRGVFFDDNWGYPIFHARSCEIGTDNEPTGHDLTFKNTVHGVLWYDPLTMFVWLVITGAFVFSFMTHRSMAGPDGIPSQSAYGAGIYGSPTYGSPPPQQQPGYGAAAVQPTYGAAPVYGTPQPV